MMNGGQIYRMYNMKVAQLLALPYWEIIKLKM